MASESSEDSVSISLPPDLAAWVDEQATARETDRESVLAGLLAAHRAAGDLEHGADVGVADVPGLDEADVEDAVRTIIAERLETITGAVAEELNVEQRVAEAVDDAASDLAASAADEAADEAADRLDGQLESVREEFWEKIEDVRDRVIQVKQETDRKAAADHSHPDLAERLSDVSEEIDDLETTVESLRTDLEEDVEEDRERLDDVEASVDDVHERLRTVAYVVKELRDSSQLRDKRETSVEEIKQRAAQLDIDRAACEVCGNGVEIALLTDPECPHCEATVNDVEPADGFFGKPHLVKAQGIEAARDADS